MLLQALTGQHPDISAILRFHFWQPVYYTLDKDENTGYSQPEEKLGDLWALLRMLVISCVP